MDTRLRNLLDYSLDELKVLMKAEGFAPFRGEQVYKWIYQGRDFDEMTNLPKEMRQSMSEKFSSGKLKIFKKLTSELDGTIKYLFDTGDGNLIESVLMKYKYGYTACISSQVGCKMGCTFCASAKCGFIRDLTPGECLGQIIGMNTDNGVTITRVVIMGIGEPLDNYDNIVKFLHLINDKEGLNISYRNISLSTCGLADKIVRLADENLPITLCISLHNPIDEQRSVIMPVNRKYALDKLLDACNIYRLRTNRRITFEYALIKGVNDSQEHASRLVKLIRGILCHVNLIPVNEVSDTGFVTVDREAVERFKALLEKDGINVTIRRSLGRDIEAACGQLRRSAINGEE
ncbi:MAG: 23S rRNA (adenine(2503)-C(2))-methyltransferase RlmN [Clostridia bacterium]|nr:23S rRNA (adenine(2503)-C(2))-methyltransferase RlmN [Clostridia bacterium]